MEKTIEFLKEYKVLVIGVIIIMIIVLIQTSLIFYLNTQKEKPVEEISTNEEEEPKEKYFYVDIKGEVKKKGTYKIEEGKRVIDVINLAGGLTSNADTSANNLSMKIKDEMVIIIYSKAQIKDFKTVKKEEALIKEACNDNANDLKNDSCIKQEETTSDKKIQNEEKQNKKVSINTGTLEELMTLSGIGESKAKSIIEYRKENKFENIEDIKNVSGIGDALYEKIKNHITL